MCHVSLFNFKRPLLAFDVYDFCSDSQDSVINSGFNVYSPRLWQPFADNDSLLGLGCKCATSQMLEYCHKIPTVFSSNPFLKGSWFYSYSCVILQLTITGNWSGQLSLCARDSGHCRDGTICKYERLVHQERSRVRRSVQSYQPSDFPRHKTNARSNSESEGNRTGSNPFSREQNWLRKPAGSAHGGGDGFGPDMGLSLRGGLCEKSDECEWSFCGNSAGNEHATWPQGQGNYLYLL